MTNPGSWVAALVLVCAVATPVVAQERPVAGRIKVSTGAAFIVRDGAQIPAQLGQTVFEADGLRTGVDGKIGVTLNDDTRLSLGPNSELKLERFTYTPADSAFRFGAEVRQGRGDLRVGSHCEARARLNPPRNAGRHHRCARDDAGHQRSA